MRKVTALFILIVVFIPLTFAALALTAVRPWILDRDFYKDITDDESLYETLLTDELPWRFDRAPFTEVEQIPVEALSSGLREVMTPAYLHAQTLNSIDTVFNYIDGSNRNFELSLDITPIKSALAAEGSIPFAAALAASLPNCEVGQPPIAPGGSLTRCIAADDTVDEAAEQIAAALPTVLDNMPDQIILSSDTLSISTNWYGLNWLPVRSVHLALDIAMLVTIFTALTAGFVGAYLGGDDLRNRLKWFGSALFFPASLFVVAGLALTAPYVMDRISSSLVAGRYSDAYREAVSHMLDQILQQLGSGLLMSGVAAGLIALGLLILSLVTSARRQQKPRMVQVPAQNL